MLIRTVNRLHSKLLTVDRFSVMVARMKIECRGVMW